MKKLAIFLVCVLLLSGFSTQTVSAFSRDFPTQLGTRESVAGKTTKILLIGNSYTLFNHLDEILERLSKSAGRKVKVTTVAKGGASLERFASKSTTEGKKVHQLLASQKWDYVVLQDRHYYPITNADKLENAVLSLKPYVEKSGAKLALYMTWAPGKGHREYTVFRHFVANKWDYQSKVAKVYKDTGKKVTALVIPVGYSFYREQRQKSSVKLLQSDKSHPSYAGSYLAACTIYSALFHESPKSSFYGELSGSTAKHLQQIAHRTVSTGSAFK